MPLTSSSPRHARICGGLGSPCVSHFLLFLLPFRSSTVLLYFLLRFGSVLLMPAPIAFLNVTCGFPCPSYLRVVSLFLALFSFPTFTIHSTSSWIYSILARLYLNSTNSVPNCIVVFPFTAFAFAFTIPSPLPRLSSRAARIVPSPPVDLPPSFLPGFPVPTPLSCPFTVLVSSSLCSNRLRSELKRTSSVRHPPLHPEFDLPLTLVSCTVCACTRRFLYLWISTVIR
jgi:hypothetical protein